MDCISRENIVEQVRSVFQFPLATPKFVNKEEDEELVYNGVLRGMFGSLRPVYRDTCEEVKSRLGC